MGDDKQARDVRYNTVEHSPSPFPFTHFKHKHKVLSGFNKFNCTDT